MFYKVYVYKTLLYTFVFPPRLKVQYIAGHKMCKKALRQISIFVTAVLSS